jgi:hypothetical protein
VFCVHAEAPCSCVGDVVRYVELLEEGLIPSISLRVFRVGWKKTENVRSKFVFWRFWNVTGAETGVLRPQGETEGCQVRQMGASGRPGGVLVVALGRPEANMGGPQWWPTTILEFLGPIWEAARPNLPRNLTFRINFGTLLEDARGKWDLHETCTGVSGLHVRPAAWSE